MSELIEIESSNKAFLVALIDWLDKQPDGEGTTSRFVDAAVRLNGAGMVAELKQRLRRTAQTLVEAVGADGPCNAEEAAERAVKAIQRYRDALVLIEATLHGQLPITKQVKEICREALG